MLCYPLVNYVKKYINVKLKNKKIMFKKNSPHKNRHLLTVRGIYHVYIIFNSFIATQKIYFSIILIRILYTNVRRVGKCLNAKIVNHKIVIYSLHALKEYKCIIYYTSLYMTYISILK